MTSSQTFFDDMEKFVELKKTEKYLSDRIKKAIHEVFRDMDLHCTQIQINEEGFKCVGMFNDISFEELEKIQNYFDKYNMGISYHNSNIAFSFKKI